MSSVCCLADCRRPACLCVHHSALRLRLPLRLLQPPGFKASWHCGMRVSSTGKLVAFISAIPATLRVNATGLQTVEINFLCVHKKLRHKRLAPVLIKVWGGGAVCCVLVGVPCSVCAVGYMVASCAGAVGGQGKLRWRAPCPVWCCSHDSVQHA